MYRFIMLLAFACIAFQSQSQTQRIVSLSGTISEIISGIGLENQLVGVDVTSTYPSSLDRLPKVGHNRNMSAEGIIALRPSLVLGIEGQSSPELKKQLESAGIKVVYFDLPYTISGSEQLVSGIANLLGQSEKGRQLQQQLHSTAQNAGRARTPRRVLFLYARGAGTCYVGGSGTAVDAMLQLSGHSNAAAGIRNFAPMTAEAVVAANPDVILLFDDGLQSLGGVDGLLKMPGIALTNAGKNRRVVTMDGLLLTGFGPRLGQALRELIQKIN